MILDQVTAEKTTNINSNVMNILTGSNEYKRCKQIVSTISKQDIHCEAKKLHRFIFAIALSELHLL